MNKTYTVYLLVAKDGNVIAQFPSIREAARVTKSDPSNIRKCANGTLKTTNHFKWQFI